MPTTVTSKIGASNSPVTMDYSTLQSWEDACPANLVTDDKIWKGECYDQGEFTAATNLLTISGMTTDATRYVWLTCATGASFADKAGVRTTALFYNASNGVALRVTAAYIGVIICSAANSLIEKLQCKVLKDNGGCRITASSTTWRQCIFQSTNSSVVFAGSSSNVNLINSLFVGNPAGSTINIVSLGRNGGTGSQLLGCTIISLSGTGRGFTADNYATHTIKDCAFFGLNNVTNTTSPSSNSSNNATDLATGFGTSNQTSLTFASQFVSTTSDFRAVATGSLDLNGTTDANLSVDISGTARAGTPTIGCWEVVATGGSAGGTLNSRIFNDGMTFAGGSVLA